MIICRACGHHNDSDDAFCASCGAFLEWEGEPDEEPAAGTEVAAGAADAGDDSSAPQPVLPARARQQFAPRQTTVRERVIRPGDLICGRCGDGNSPDRNFCRRCGHSLAEAETAQRRRWWHRFQRRRRTYAAGERRGRRGRMREAAKKGRTARVKARMSVGKVVRTVGMVAILAGAAGAAGVAIVPSLRSSVGGWASDRVNDVRDWGSPSYEAVRPVDADATSWVRGHPPIHAVDLTDNLWWAAKGGRDDGIGERLILEFGKPVELGIVGITPGAADPKEYAAQPRPRELRLVFDDGATETLDIADEHEFQTFELDEVGETKRLVVEVTGVYRGQTGHDLAITSLEFQTPT